MYSSSWQVFNHDGKRKYTDEAEFRRFLAATKLLPPPQRAFCQLVAYTGCRPSEARALNRACIHAEGAVTLRTLKQRKERFRTLPIPEWLARDLLALPLDQTEPEKVWAVNRSTVYRWTKRAMMLARVQGIQACPKGLRHGFGMRAADRGTPGNLIQRWLGHAWFTTTAVYLDAVGREERKFASRTW